MAITKLLELQQSINNLRQRFKVPPRLIVKEDNVELIDTLSEAFSYLYEITDRVLLKDGTGLVDYSKLDDKYEAKNSTLEALAIIDNGDGILKRNSDGSWSIINDWVTKISVEEEGNSVSNASTINFTGEGVTVTEDNGKVHIDVPGQPPANTVLYVSQPKSTSFTLDATNDNSLIPVSDDIVVTIPVGLPHSFVCVLLQNTAHSFTIETVNGVIIDAPSGLESQGQFSTISILQLADDTYLVTVSGSNTQSTSGESSSNTLYGSSNNGGTLLVGAGSISGGGVATYVQVGNLITVTWNNHGLTSDRHDGMNVILKRGTGLLGVLNDNNPPWSTYFDICSGFTYVDSNTFTCISSNTLNTSGSLGEINSAWYFFPACYITIPPNTLGKNGYLRACAYMSSNNSSGSKKLAIFFGPNTIENNLGTNNIIYVDIANNRVATIQDLMIINRNATNKQVITNNSTGDSYGPESKPRITRTVDTTIESRVTFGISLANSTDWAILEYAFIELTKSA
jgi:hypothetical protein